MWGFVARMVEDDNDAVVAKARKRKKFAIHMVVL